MKHQFTDRSLLELALTHSSWANQHGGDHNERLEFLGDAVLQLCATELLYDEHSEQREGVLSRFRSQLVKNSYLAGLARQWGLDEQVRLGGSLQGDTDDRELERVLAGAFEAVLAAIFLDGGFQAARAEVQDALRPNIHGLTTRDVRQILDVWSQAKYGDRANFEVVNQVGPDHDRVFHVVVRVNSQPVGEGSGRTKKAASAAAAEAAILALGIKK